VALPTVVLQWCPSRSQSEDVPDGEWVTIDRPLVSAHTQRGVERRPGRVEAGEAELMFLDPGRLFDPHNRQSPNWPTFNIGRPLRLRATVGATTETFWQGHLVDAYPVWEQRAVWTVVRGRDRLAWLARQKPPRSYFEWLLGTYDPLWWWKLDEGGGDRAFNSGRDNAAIGTYQGVSFSAERVAPYVPPGAASFTGADSNLSVPTNRQMPGPITVLAWGRFPSDGIIYSQGPGDSTHPTGDIVLYVSGGNPNFVVRDAGAGQLATTSASADDGGPHMIVGRWSPFSPPSVWMDSGGSPAPGNWTTPPRVGSITVGNGRSLGQPGGTLSHVAVWGGVIDDITLVQFHLAATRALADDSPGARMTSIMFTILGLPFALWGMSGQTGPNMGAEQFGPDYLSVLRRVAESARGLLVADRTDRIILQGAQHQGTPRGIYDSAPDADPTAGGHAPLQDYEIVSDEQTFITLATTRVGSPEPYDVTYRRPTADIYGEISYDADTNYVDEQAAADSAREIVGAGVPRQVVARASTIIDSPGADALSLVRMEVGDTETDIGRIPDTTAGAGPWMTWGSGAFWAAADGRGWAGVPPIEQESRILRVEHDIDFARKIWTVHRYLEPQQ